MGSAKAGSVRWLFLIAVLALLSFCTIHKQSSDAIQGWLVEEQTGMPVDDALVVAVWHEPVGYDWHEPGRRATMFREAITDREGRFYIDAWSRWQIHIISDRMQKDEPAIYVLKEGYRTVELRSKIDWSAPKWTDHTIFIFPDTSNKIKLKKIAELDPYPDKLASKSMIHPGYRETPYYRLEKLFSSPVYNSQQCLIEVLPIFVERYTSILRSPEYEESARKISGLLEYIPAGRDRSLDPKEYICKTDICKQSMGKKETRDACSHYYN